MLRFRLALLAVVLGFVGAAAGCGKPAAAGVAAQDDPWQVLNRDWRVVAASSGTTPYRPEEVKDWAWTFTGMIRKTDLIWLSPPADFPHEKHFATTVFLHEPRP